MDAAMGIDANSRGNAGSEGLNFAHFTPIGQAQRPRDRDGCERKGAHYFASCYHD
jgi:hypothetical protein